MSDMLGSWPGREENAKIFALRMHRIRPATQAQSAQRPWLLDAYTMAPRQPSAATRDHRTLCPLTAWG